MHQSSVGSNKLLMKCHLEETWNWNDCFQLSCVDAFRSQLLACSLASFHFFFRSSADCLEVYCFFILRSRLEFYFLNFCFVSWTPQHARAFCLCALPMFTLIKFIGQQLRRVGISASFALPRSVSQSKSHQIPSTMNRKSQPPPQSQSARSGGWKSLIQLPQQHDFLRLKRTTYTAFDSRICCSQYSAPPYLFFFRDCFASYFFALTKMPFSLITHILRGTTTIRPSWHFLIHANTTATAA